MTTDDALRELRLLLDRYRFVASGEADLQRQVVDVLRADPRFEIAEEVIVDRGRYDILARIGGLAIVLELKIRGAAAAVERQAQRYAKMPDVDAVAVVTTSARLAAALLAPSGAVPPNTLGGKPFRAFTLRAF